MSYDRSDIDEALEIVSRAQRRKEIEKAEEEKRNTQNNPKEKSYTKEKQSKKREKFFRYQLPSFFMAAVISITSAAVTSKIIKIKDTKEKNDTEKQIKSYIEQIYNENEQTHANALNKNKYNVPGLDSYGHPLWAVDYYKVVKEYLELPDETVNSNLYTFYQYFKNDYADFDDFINELSIIIENLKDDYPYTYELIGDCRTFKKFLEKNYTKYQLEGEDLKATFERMNRDHYSVIDLPELQEEARGTR